MATNDDTTTPGADTTDDPLRQAAQQALDVLSPVAADVPNDLLTALAEVAGQNGSRGGQPAPAAKAETSAQRRDRLATLLAKMDTESGELRTLIAKADVAQRAPMQRRLAAAKRDLEDVYLSEVSPGYRRTVAAQAEEARRQEAIRPAA